VARFPDLSKEEKEFIVESYVQLTGEEKEGIVAFLNYENDLFCS
jgi:hypothetical protein